MLLANPVYSAESHTPTIEQMAAFPAYSNFSLSPDGRHIAALRANGEDRVIAVWNTDAMDKQPTLLGSQKMKIAQVQFIKNGMLAVTLWQPYDLRAEKLAKTFIYKLMLTDLDGKHWREPLPQERAMSRSAELEQSLSNPTVLDTLPNDDDHILVVNNVGSTSGDVYKVNVRTMRTERIQQSDEKVNGYQTDLAGNLRARRKADVDGKGAFISTEFRDIDSERWQQHFKSYVKNRDVNQVIGFAEDPNIAFILSNEGRDKSVIYEYNIRERKRVESMFEHRFFNASGISVNKDKDATLTKYGDILGIYYQGPQGDDVQWTSPAMVSLDAGLRKALNLKTKPLRLVDPATGREVKINYPVDVDYRLIDYSPDGKIAILMTSGSASPPKYFLFKDNQLKLLAEAYPDIKPRDLGNSELVYYKARDGLDIPAFLTKPNSEKCGNAPWPSVVHPHGGPWARDDLGFDNSMWIPLMTSRCFAVLQPQYRGSAGWGRKLWMAGDAEWGQKMQDDKDDGVKWLVDQKIAIPGRVAMFGYSYGGYAAFAASVRPNGLYKCAIAGAGVSDINRIWARFYTDPFFRESQASTVEGLSPLHQAAEIKIPIMVYHGDRDRTVPIEQSEWFVDAVKRSAKPVEYHRFADYGHGPAWTRQTFGEQLRVIEKYLLDGCGGNGL